LLNIVKYFLKKECSIRVKSVLNHAKFGSKAIRRQTSISQKPSMSYNFIFLICFNFQIGEINPSSLTYFQKYFFIPSRLSMA
jgi:hypothetical protein